MAVVSPGIPEAANFSGSKEIGLKHRLRIVGATIGNAIGKRLNAVGRWIDSRVEPHDNTDTTLRIGRAALCHSPDVLDDGKARAAGRRRVALGAFGTVAALTVAGGTVLSAREGEQRHAAAWQPSPAEVPGDVIIVDGIPYEGPAGEPVEEPTLGNAIGASIAAYDIMIAVPAQAEYTGRHVAP